MMNAKVLATWHAEQRDALADAIKRFDSGELDNGIMFSIRAEQHDFHKRAAVLIDRLSAEVEALRADAEHDAKGAEMSTDAMKFVTNPRNVLPNGLTLLQQNPDCAARLDPSATDHGWLYIRHPDGHWVTLRKLSNAEIETAWDQAADMAVLQGTDAMRAALEQLSFVFVNEGETAAEALRRVRDVARAALAQPASELAHGTINNGQGN